MNAERTSEHAGEPPRRFARRWLRWARWPFRRRRKARGLQHKLTRSYLAVTLCAVVIVELLLGVLIWLVATQTSPSPLYLARQNRERAALVTPALLLPARASALKTQLTGLRRDDRLSLAISDASGRVLASAPDDWVARNIVLPNRRLAALRPAFGLALKGEALPGQLGALDADGGSLAVSAIRGLDGRVAGLLWARTAPPPRLRDFSQAVIGLVLVSAVIVGLFAGGVGLCFGWMNARRLTQRLRVISEAADGWSRGEFAVVANDGSDDEIGQLARRLNLMAFQLQELVALRQTLATSEERNRLSRELHDTVKQKLFATNMQIGAARVLLGRDVDGTQARLLDAERLGSQAQQELTAILEQLRPGSYQNPRATKAPEIRLEDALRDYLRDWSSRPSSVSSIQAELLAQPLPPLEGAVGQALFRVAQEALANIARHSQATSAKVHLYAQGEDIVLSIADNGRGFDLAGVANGLGLHTMRERTEALPGGRFFVQSQVGSGTRIEARVKVRIEARAEIRNSIAPESQTNAPAAQDKTHG